MCVRLCVCVCVCVCVLRSVVGKDGEYQMTEVNAVFLSHVAEGIPGAHCHRAAKRVVTYLRGHRGRTRGEEEGGRRASSVIPHRELLPEEKKCEYAKLRVCACVYVYVYVCVCLRVCVCVCV